LYIVCYYITEKALLSTFIYQICDYPELKKQIPPFKNIEWNLVLQLTYAPRHTNFIIY